MEIPKEKILDMLHQEGKSDQAAEADKELPDKVDPGQHGAAREVRDPAARGALQAERRYPWAVAA